MAQVLTFLNTSPVHVATFNQLLGTQHPEIEVRHVVNEGLLKAAQAAGGVNKSVAEAVQAIVQEELSQNPGILLCTCSTIGPVAEAVDSDKVIRVDRPMARMAVTTANQIVVLAALKTTLTPTVELILDEAKRAGKEVEVTTVLCESAWAKFEQGDKNGYLEEIARYIDESASLGEIIVLAQASMAGAEKLYKQRQVPVLSSPGTGLEAALAALAGNK